jgi:hypothetical protein
VSVSPSTMVRRFSLSKVFNIGSESSRNNSRRRRKAATLSSSLPLPNCSLEQSRRITIGCCLNWNRSRDRRFGVGQENVSLSEEKFNLTTAKMHIPFINLKPLDCLPFQGKVFRLVWNVTHFCHGILWEIQSGVYSSCILRHGKVAL